MPGKNKLEVSLMQITAETTVNEAIKMSKKILSVLKGHNLYCSSCKAQQQDTIKHVAANNGLDLKSFIEELNREL